MPLVEAGLFVVSRGSGIVDPRVRAKAFHTILLQGVNSVFCGQPISRDPVAIDARFGRLVQSDKALTPYLILRQFLPGFFRHGRNAA